MTSTRFLDFDSTYRNRKEWPQPAEFDLIISQSGRKGKASALDPVCESQPKATWTSNQFDADGGGATVVATPVANDSTPTVMLVRDAGAIQLQNIDGYYVGAIIGDGTSIRRVIEYKYIGFNTATSIGTALITVDTAFTAVPASVTITDPTDVTLVNNPIVFVPNGLSGNNSYYNYILYDETTNTYRTITKYDSVTRLVTVNATSAVGWANTDTFSIRKSLPAAVGTIDGTSTVTSVINNGALVFGSLSTTDNYYRGDFLRCRTLLQSREITAYNATTGTFTVSPAFSSVPSGTYEILPFSYDNLNPFSYNGSTVSQEQDVCYEIELLDLVLPNQILNASEGSRIAFYPYVYIELTSKTSSSANNLNILYSNNPNATKMLFRVAIDDISNQASSAFIKNDGDGAKQTIKFKPNDSLHLSVRLPDGTLFQTILSETYSPAVPNPLIQISGMFSLKRLGD